MGSRLLSECVLSVIDHRGLTPKKLGGEWASSGGHRAISAKNIKNGCLVQQETMNLVDEEMYRRWMPEEVDRGDIFITSEAPFGEVLYWDSDEKPVLSQRVFGLKVNPSVCDARYLYYWMRTPQFQGELRGRSTGTTVIGLRQPELLKCEVETPSLNAQLAISSVLTTIDKKIAVNAKLNGYLADAVDGLFEKALGQAEEKTLTDVVEILSGGTPKTKISEYWEDGEIPFFGPGDANGSTYCLTTAKHITQLGLENCNSELYPVDTVFLTARGTVGKVAMAGKPMAMNQSCFAFRGLGVSQPAVYQIIKRAVRSLKVKANGATFAAINTRDLKIEAILVPSDEELTAFEEEAASLHSMMRVNEEESLKLSSLRDALLSKLIAGEIDVSKVDLTQINSHLPKRWYVLLQIQGHPYIPATAATAVTQACVGTMKD